MVELKIFGTKGKSKQVQQEEQVELSSMPRKKIVEKLLKDYEEGHVVFEPNVKGSIHYKYRPGDNVYQFKFRKINETAKVSGEENTSRGVGEDNICKFERKIEGNGIKYTEKIEKNCCYCQSKYHFSIAQRKEDPVSTSATRILRCDEVKPVRTSVSLETEKMVYSIHNDFSGDKTKYTSVEDKESGRFRKKIFFGKSGTVDVYRGKELKEEIIIANQ